MTSHTYISNYFIRTHSYLKGNMYCLFTEPDTRNIIDLFKYCIEIFVTLYQEILGHILYITHGDRNNIISFLKTNVLIQ